MKTPSLRKKANGHYKLTGDWLVSLSTGGCFRVPSGYSTNGITAPKWAKKLMGDGVNREETWCAIFHDYLFSEGVEAKKANNLFRQAMKHYKVVWWKRIAMSLSTSLYSSIKHQ